MKVAIGAIDHHTLQVESPTEVADADAAGAEGDSGRSGWCCRRTAAWGARA